MTTDQLIAAIEASLAQYRAELAPPPPVFRVVGPSEDLQAALNTATLPIHLVAGEIYPGVTLATGTRLVGNGARLVGVARRAIYVAPGSSDIRVSGVVCTSNQDSVVQLGDNSAATQGTVARVPSGIVLENVSVPTHRGKRAFEVHATNVELINCEALDCFYPGTWEPKAGVDSQGLWIFNTPGNVTVRGGRYQGGSECMMTAGDDIKLSDCPTISNLLFEDVLFDRPAAWRGDISVYRQVKNIFELKNACDVIVRRCTLRECWKEAQDGYALMLTPTRGGRVVNVLFEDCLIEHVGGFMNVTGIDSSGLCSVRTTGIRWVRGSVSTNRAVYGGAGRTVLLTSGAGTVDFEDTNIAHDGTSLVYASGSMTERIRLRGSTFNAGQYGVNVAGGANLANWAAGCVDVDVTGNTISGSATALRTNLAAIGKVPANVYA